MKKTSSSAALSDQIQQAFETAGSDVDPIMLDCSRAEFEIDEITNKLSQQNEWDDKVDGIKRGMALVNGRALECEAFRKGIARFIGNLLLAATDLRSALVKIACLFIAQLAREIGSDIDYLGDLIRPLSGQLGHGTQIIADSSRFAILALAKYCPTRRIFLSLIDLSSHKGNQQKATAAQALAIAINIWPIELLESLLPKIENVLKKLISDSTTTIRSYARKAVKALSVFSPSTASTIISSLDTRAKKAFDDELPLPEEERLPDAPRRAAATIKNIHKSPLSEQYPEKTIAPKDYLKIITDDHSIPDSNDLKRQRKTPPVSPKPKNNFNITSRMSSSVHKKTRKQFDSFKHDFSSDPEEKKPDKINGKNESPIRKKASSPIFDINDDFLEEELIQDEKFTSSMPIPNKNSKITFDDEKEEEDLESLNPNFELNHMKQSPLKLTKLTSGNEALFLENLNNAIAEGNLELLEENINTFPKDLLNCCSSPTEVISYNALISLTDLLPDFVNAFKPLLQFLVGILLLQSESDSPKCAAAAGTALHSLNAYYSPSLIVSSIIENPESPTHIKFLWEILSSMNGPISDVQKILEDAFISRDIDDIKARHAAAHIIEKIYQKYPEEVKIFTDSLVDEDLKDFQEFMLPYVPEMEFSSRIPKVPKYTLDGAITFKKTATQLIQELDDYTWNQIHIDLLEEINKGLLLRNSSDLLLNLLQNLINIRGEDDFGIVIPGLLVNAMEYSMVESIFQTIVSLSYNNIDNIFSPFQPIIEGNNPGLCHLALIMERRIIATLSIQMGNQKGQRKMTQIISHLIPGLSKCIGNESAILRKASVMCFAELCCIIGEDNMNRQIGHLSDVQQKLIKAYYMKLMQN